MTQEPAITSELQAFVGKEEEVGSYEIEKGAIKKFAEAIQDPNPLYYDEEYAKKTRYGGIIAPLTFIHASWDIGYPRFALSWPEHMINKMNVGNEFEWYIPLRPGDIITGKKKLTKMWDKMGRSGKMVFFVGEMTYYNQDGELVGKLRSTSIRY